LAGGHGALPSRWLPSADVAHAAVEMALVQAAKVQEVHSLGELYDDMLVV